jgi:hypothetical protein
MACAYASGISPQATRAPPPLGGGGVVVAAGMHHQGLAAHVRQLQPRRQHGVGGTAVRRHVQRRQITQVTVAPGGVVALAAFRIKVSAGGQGRDPRAVLLSRRAGAVGVHVEAVQAGLEPAQVRREHQTVGSFLHAHLAERCAGAAGIHGLERHAGVRGLRKTA